MPSSSTLLALATAITAVNAAYQGFNYGSTFTDGRPKAQSDFEAEFKTAAGLEGTDGAFTSARLYTMVQGGTANDPISAIPAAISTKTSLLLGLWASAGGDAFDNEIAALKKTIDQYCGKLDGLVAGISVGSEDLYRITPIGQQSNAGPGAQPGTLVSYIKQVRDTIKSSCLKNVPIGHVDTWNAYIVDSNKPLIEECDWIGMDTYPYFEDTKPNAIENGKKLYEDALKTIQGVSGGKDIWITETGWPVSGKTSGQAIASTDNAQSYWQQVGCPNFGKVNVWWYTMQDAAPATPNPSFGVIGSQLTTKPLYDLSCKNVKPTSSSSASGKPTSSASGSGSATTGAPATTSGADNGDSSTQPTTLATAPFPSTNGTVPNTSGSGASPTSPGSNPGSGSGGSSPTSVPGSSGNKLNSFGAAAVALVLAVVAL